MCEYCDLCYQLCIDVCHIVYKMYKFSAYEILQGQKKRRDEPPKLEGSLDTGSFRQKLFKRNRRMLCTVRLTVKKRFKFFI